MHTARQVPEIKPDFPDRGEVLQTRHFSDDEQKRFSKHVQDALLLNNALACKAQRKRVRLFKILPKHHAMLHVGLDSFTNPRRRGTPIYG